MKKLVIEITGKTDSDLLIALEYVTKGVEEGYVTGHDSNDSGRYLFNVTGEEDPYAREDFSSEVTASGFMLKYKGKPIGGSAVASRMSPRVPPARGRAKSANRRLFIEQAERAIDAILAGNGEQRFLDEMATIDRELDAA